MTAFDEAKLIVLFQRVTAFHANLSVILLVLFQMIKTPRVRQRNRSVPILLKCFYTSAISLNRLMVDLVAAAAGVLENRGKKRVRQARMWCEDLNTAFKNLRNSPCASSDSLLAALALPDSDRVSLDCVLPAEGADVSGMLGDFHLLDLFSEGCTVSSTVLAGHADLCRHSQLPFLWVR